MDWKTTELGLKSDKVRSNAQQTGKTVSLNERLTFPEHTIYDAALSAAKSAAERTAHFHDVWQVAPHVVVVFDPSLEDPGLFSVKEKPWSITLNPNESRLRLICVHELGHFADRILGGDCMASEADPRLEPWRTAVSNTTHVTDWNALAQSPRGAEMYDEEMTIRELVEDYVLSDPELFARSYSQYVITRSGDPLMREELASAIRGRYDGQWKGGDFAPVAREFDRLFRTIQWI